MLKVVGASWTQTRASWLMLAAVILLGTFAIFFVESPKEVKDGNYAATVTWAPYSGFEIEFWGQGNDPQTIKKGVARAYYRPDMSATGWAVMEIETQPEYPDWVQAHAAGLLEGSLSWQLIYWHWQNTIERTCENREEFCVQARDFFRENTANIKQKSRKLSSTDPFWHQVSLFYHQLEGIDIGWQYAVKRSLQDYEIEHSDFLWMNVVCDLKDLELKLDATVETDPKRPSLTMALLKLVPTNVSQFLLAHASSAFYSAMLRVQKHYRFGYHLTSVNSSALVPNQVLAFTSYPGAIHSQDDFYQISGTKNFTITGTGIKNLNSLLWDDVNATAEVLMGPRVLAANRLSQNGHEWFSYMNKSNSGTGNKQWMVIQPLNNTVSLWVVEQLPGITHGEDQTGKLNQTGYWGSYGYPYYMDILNLSGYANYSNNTSLRNPVAEVLEQGQKNVTDIESLISLMRSPALALVGRSDLSLEDIQNYTFYWENKYNQSRNARSTADVEESNEILQTDTTKHLYNFRDVSNLIIQLKRLNDEVKQLTLNTVHIKEVQEELPITNVNSKVTVLNEDQKERVLSLREFSGTIDLKISGPNVFRAAAGPPFSISHGSIVVKPFIWSKSPIKDLPHFGQSDVWEYNPVEIQWVWN